MRRSSISRDSVRRTGESGGTGGGVVTVTAAPGSSIVIGGTPTNPVIGSSTIQGAGGTDIEFFKVSTSVAGQTTAPNWDRYRLWGQHGQGQSNSGIQLPDDTLFAIPQMFNRSGTITDVTAFCSANTGSAVLVVGISTNHADGEVFPGTLIAQSPEFSFPTNVPPNLYRWTGVGVHVPAGSLVWLWYSQKKDLPTSQFFHMTADVQIHGTGLLGSSGIGGATGFPGPGFNETPIQQSALTLARAYNAVLPATYPLVGVFATVPSQTTYGAYMPSLAYRFVKD